MSLLVRALKSVDLPTLGNPTMPIETELIGCSISATGVKENLLTSKKCSRGSLEYAFVILYDESISMKKHVVIIGGAIIIIGALIGYGVMAGWVQFGKTTADLTDHRVCADMIGPWNTLMGDEATSRGTDDLTAKITEIESKDRYDLDPTCNYMLFRAYLMTAGLEGATKAFDRLKAQTAQGLNPSIELVDITRMSEVERVLKELRDELEHPAEINEDGLSQGG